MNVLAYLDESGTHRGSRAIAVAGFLGRPDAWGAFAFEWTREIEAWGLDTFHMAQFESRRPGYDWPEEVRRARLNRLLEIIDRHVAGSVGITFSMEDYDAVFPPDEIPEGPNIQELAPGILAPGSLRPGDPEPAPVDYRPGELRRKTGGPYGLAATAVMLDAAKIAWALPGERFVDYVFEDGASGRGQLRKVAGDILADEPSRRDMRVSSFAFRSKSEAPLQAADLLAYELHKHLPRELGQEDRPVRYTLRRLAGMPRRWGRLDVDELRKWHHVLGRGLHYSLGTWNR